MAVVTDEQYTLEQADEDIADLRGTLGEMGEFISTGTVDASVAVVTNDLQTATAEVSGALTATGGTSGAPSVITNGTWQSLGTLTNFTVNRARYRLTNDGEVEIDVSVTASAAVVGTTSFSNALVSPFIPANSCRLPMASTKVVAVGDANARLFVTSVTGVVQVIVTAGVAASYDCTIRCPLN